jgi:hypothetical protein
MVSLLIVWVMGEINLVRSSGMIVASGVPGLKKPNVTGLEFESRLSPIFYLTTSSGISVTKARQALPMNRRMKLKIPDLQLSVFILIPPYAIESCWLLPTSPFR